MSNETLGELRDPTVKPGDRIRFDGKRTSWLIRAQTEDGRYQVATCSMFGRVYYTVIDHHENVRGPLNVIGQGMGIFTTKGPDDAIDNTVSMLESGGFEVSHRNRVALRIEAL
jgi:hypothetical protein